jgi:hypothetical protein
LAVDEHAPVLADQLLAAYGSGNLPEIFGFRLRASNSSSV